MRTSICVFASLLCWLVTSTAHAHPTVFILLSAQEALPDDPKQPGFQLIPGVDRVKAPVRFGVPLPNDTSAFEPTQVIMIKAGDYQKKVIKRWPSRRIQWLLVDAQVDLKANGQITDIFLTSGTDLPPTPMAQETDTIITIPTGAATFTVRKDRFRLIDQVVINGKNMLKDNAAAGIVLTALDGTRYFASLDQKANVTLEDNGPVRVTVKATGMHVASDGKDLLDFTVRMHFYKDKSRVKIVYTLRNASKRRLENVQFKSASLVWQTDWDKGNYLVKDHQGESKGALTDAAKLRLFQGENASPTIRDAGYDKQFWPTGISGYKLTLDGQALKQGGRDDYIQLFYAQSRAADGRAVMVGTRFAAGHWPQGLGLDGDGTIHIGVFPEDNDKPYIIRFGGHITRECVISFEEKAAASPRDEFFRFQYPVVMKPTDPDWFNQDEMLFIRLISFKEEAAFLKDKGWPFDDRPDASANRRPQFAVPRYIDWGVDVLERRISPGRLATVNFLRQTQAFAGAYYLAAEQRMMYNADRSILHSDDYNELRVRDEVPGLRDGNGGVKDPKSLPNGDKLPPSPRWTDQNLHGYGMALWYHISGDRRIADSYYDWGEHMLRRSQQNPSAKIFGMNLFNVIELHRFTRQVEYQRRAWDMIQKESLDKVAVAGVSGGTDLQRGAYVGDDKAKDADRKLSTFAQARAVAGAYALFLESSAADDDQADRARDQLEGISRFVAQELWRTLGDKAGDFGMPPSFSLDQKAPADPRAQTGWAGGVQDAFIAMYFGYLMTSEFDFLRKGEMLLKAAAFNPGLTSWYQDLPGRQMLQYLLENTVLFAVWRPLPVVTAKLKNGEYHVTLLAPYGARKYWIKYSDKKIVPSLGYNPVTQTYQHDPKTHTPFFAATNISNEPEPIDPGIYQAIKVTGLEPGKTYYFAARYLTSDPRPPITEPTGEPGEFPDAAGEPTVPESLPDGAEPGSPETTPAPDTASEPAGDAQDRVFPGDSSKGDGMPPVGCHCGGCQQGGDITGWLGLWLLLGFGWLRRRKQLHERIPR